MFDFFQLFVLGENVFQLLALSENVLFAFFLLVFVGLLALQMLGFVGDGLSGALDGLDGLGRLGGDRTGRRREENGFTETGYVRKFDG